MRLTLGQRPVTSAAQPADRQIRPATARRPSLARAVPSCRSQSPAIRPSSIVPSVGIKLSVAYPPPLNKNGFARGNRFRNQTSNAQARLVFLFQWAAKPV